MMTTYNTPDCGTTIEPCDIDFVPNIYGSGRLFDPFSGFFNLTNLGSISEISSPYGGLIISPIDYNKLFIIGNSNKSTTEIFSVDLIRDKTTNSIVAVAPATTTKILQAPFADAGLAYYDDILFVSSWPAHKILQYVNFNTIQEPSSITDIDVARDNSIAGLGFVPSDWPSGNKFKFVVWPSGKFYTINLGIKNNTYSINSIIKEGPELPDTASFIYYSKNNNNSNIFFNNSIITSEWGGSKICCYEVDNNGEVIFNSKRVMVEGLLGANGLAIDPITGDILCSTFGLNPQDKIILLSSRSSASTNHCYGQVTTFCLDCEIPTPPPPPQPKPVCESSVEPINTSPIGCGYSANINFTAGSIPTSSTYYGTTNVGNNGNPSFYGTYDQLGNVSEWNDKTYNINSILYKGLRGASYSTQIRVENNYAGAEECRICGVNPTVNNPSTNMYPLLLFGDNIAPFMSVGGRLCSNNNPNNFSSFVTVYGGSKYIENDEIIGDEQVNEPYLCGQTNDFSFGSVAYDFQIMKFEITNQEYVHFLNSVGNTTDSLCWACSVFSSGENFDICGIIKEYDVYQNKYVWCVKKDFANKPIVGLTWYSLARFCNWLHNGANSDSDTENGAYNLSQNNLEKNNDAKYWIPTIDEWIKSGFYDPKNKKYYDYATQRDFVVVPTFDNLKNTLSNTPSYPSVNAKGVGLGFCNTTSPADIVVSEAEVVDNINIFFSTSDITINNEFNIYNTNKNYVINNFSTTKELEVSLKIVPFGEDPNNSASVYENTFFIPPYPFLSYFRTETSLELFNTDTPMDIYIKFLNFSSFNFS